MGKTKKTILGAESTEELVQKNVEKKEKKEKKLEQKKAKKEEVISAEGKVEKKKKAPVVKKHGKKYLKARDFIVKSKHYSVTEAVSLLKKMSFESFPASVELHINTIDTSVKGELMLPHGTGKEVNVAVFSSELEEKLKKNVIDFDILLAQPSDMKVLVKYSKLLGPKGLMPTPKRGTLTENIDAAKKKFLAGSLNYKTEPKFPIMHQVVGKITFTEKQLVENVTLFLSTVQKKNIVSAYIKTSMTPAVPLLITE